MMSENTEAEYVHTGSRVCHLCKNKTVSFPVFWTKYHHYGEQSYGL